MEMSEDLWEAIREPNQVWENFLLLLSELNWVPAKELSIVMYFILCELEFFLQICTFLFCKTKAVMLFVNYFTFHFDIQHL